MKHWKTALMSLTLALLAACGGGGGGTTNPPPDPATFTAAALSSTSVKLDWSASTGATGYSVERKTGAGAFAVIQPNLAATTFTDTGLSPSTAYTYRVKALNAKGASAGKEASATTPGPTTNPPADPATFTAAAQSSAAIKLDWSAVSGATGYSLERKSGAAAYAVIQASLTGTTFTDTGLTPSTKYDYRLKAVNAGGSSAGKEASATTQAPPASGDFTLSLNPATLSLAPGGNAPTTVTVNRTGGFTGDVTLSLEGSITGAAAADKVSGVFAPNPASGGSATLTLTVGAGVPAGDYALTVRGVSGGLDKTAALALKVTAPKTVLLVDDDCSPNNQNPANPSAAPSASDTLFRGLLDAQSLGYNVSVVSCSGGYQDGPNFDAMKDYQTVLWYTADEYGGTGNRGTVSSADEINLRAFLDQGNRKAILFSNSYVYGLSGTTWTATTNTFFSNYIGAQGGENDKLNNVAFTASGAAGQVTAGLSLEVANGTPIATYTDPINPKAGTDTLVTAQLDPDGSGGDPLGTWPIAVGRKNVGTAGTSKAIYLGFSFENIVDVGANSKANLFGKLLSY